MPIRRVRQLRNRIRNEAIMHGREKSKVRQRKKKSSKKYKRAGQHPSRTLLSNILYCYFFYQIEPNEGTNH